MIEYVRLHPDDVEAIARRVAELQSGGSILPAAELLDAAEVAQRFGVSRDWVYANKARLGAVPIGGGSRPRLRFDAARIVAALDSPQRPVPAAPADQPRRRRRVVAPPADLLPIRGMEA